jgi:hypothetical protein
MPESPIIFVIEARQNVRTMLEMTLSSMTSSSATSSLTTSSMTASSERIRVFSAVSLGSALLQLRVLHPDLIIVGSDGPELTTRAAVAQVKALAGVPLLLLGWETAPKIPGVDGTLRYPLDIGELFVKVMGVLCGGSRTPAGPP